MFATISGVVYSPIRGTKDRLGNPVRSFDDGTAVSGLLVSPGGTDDLEAARPDGVSVDLTAHFPKTWTSDLRGCELELAAPYDGIRWRVIGEPKPYMDDNTPGEWYMPVELVRANG